MKHIESACTDREKLLYRLHVLAKEMGQVFTAAVSTSCTKLEILHEVERRGELSQLELQQQLELDAAAVTRHLQQLKQQELIASRKPEQDKRVTLISLTDNGRAELLELEKKRRECLEQMTRDFSDEDIAVITEYMDRITRNIARMNEEEATL